MTPREHAQARQQPEPGGAEIVSMPATTAEAPKPEPKEPEKPKGEPRPPG